MAVKLGEVEETIALNVSKDEELWVMLRAHTVDKSKEVALKPAVDLQANDKIKITIEKI